MTDLQNTINNDNLNLIMGYEMEVGSRRNRRISVNMVRRALIDANINWVYVVPDAGTVDAEVVFLPLVINENSVERYIKPVQEVVESIGGYIRVRCGGHVHVGTRPTSLTPEDFNTRQVEYWKRTTHDDLSGKRGSFICPTIKMTGREGEKLLPFELIKDVIYSYAKYQDYINSILPESRRLDTYDSWHRPIHRILESQNFHSARTIGSFSSSELGKRNAINTEPFGSKETIEFRQGASTLNPQNILMWCKFIKHLYMQSALFRCNWSTYVIPQSTRTIDATTPYQHGNGRSFVSRVYDMCRNSNNGQGATIEEIMNATGAGDQNIRSRISEFRRTYGQGAIITHTQQANNHVYGDGQIYCRYQILHNFTKTINDDEDRMPTVQLVETPNYDVFQNMSEELRSWNDQLIQRRRTSYVPR